MNENMYFNIPVKYHTVPLSKNITHVNCSMSLIIFIKDIVHFRKGPSDSKQDLICVHYFFHYAFSSRNTTKFTFEICFKI